MVREEDVPNYINKFFINIGLNIDKTIKQTVRCNRNARARLPSRLSTDYFEISELREVDVYKEVININTRKSSGLPDLNSKILKRFSRCLSLN